MVLIIIIRITLLIILGLTCYYKFDFSPQSIGIGLAIYTIIISSIEYNWNDQLKTEHKKETDKIIHTIISKNTVTITQLINCLQNCSNTNLHLMFEALKSEMYQQKVYTKQFYLRSENNTKIKRILGDLTRYDYTILKKANSKNAIKGIKFDNLLTILRELESELSV